MKLGQQVFSIEEASKKNLVQVRLQLVLGKSENQKWNIKYPFREICPEPSTFLWNFISITFILSKESQRKHQLEENEALNDSLTGSHVTSILLL